KRRKEWRMHADGMDEFRIVEEVGATDRDGKAPPQRFLPEADQTSAVAAREAVIARPVVTFQLSAYRFVGTGFCDRRPLIDRNRGGEHRHVNPLTFSGLAAPQKTSQHALHGR